MPDGNGSRELSPYSARRALSMPQAKESLCPPQEDAKKSRSRSRSRQRYSKDGLDKDKKDTSAVSERRHRSRSRERRPREERESPEPYRKPRERSKDKRKERSTDRKRDRSRERIRDRPREMDRDRSKQRHRERSREKKLDRSKDRHRDRSRDRRRDRSREKDSTKPRRKTRSPRRSASPLPYRPHKRRGRSPSPTSSKRRKGSSSPPPRRRKHSSSPPPKRTKRTPSPHTRSKKPLPDQEVSFRGLDDSAQPPTKYGGAPPTLQKPNFAPTGLLAKSANTVAGTKISLKYHEPAEARKPSPNSPWSLFIFKGKDTIGTVQLHTQSCWLLGKAQQVADIVLEHPSSSQQHAAIQFRYIVKTTEDAYGVRQTKGRVKPYIIDLESSNGTELNGEKVEAGRYVELRDKDLLQFAGSEREYVIMLPPKEE